MNNRFEVCIIGAGIIGLAIAERLSKIFDDIVIIEKESSFGMHVSSRNSEVIHSGFYYPQNSLKATLCVQGNHMIYDFVNKYNVHYKRCGKLIVINDLDNEQKLYELKKHSEENGIDDIKILSENESLSIDSRIKCKKSLWIPSAGIIDSHGIMSKLLSLSLSRGVFVAYKTLLSSINKEGEWYKLKFENNEENILSKIVINAAGLWSHKIAEMLDISNYKIEYYKGDYYKCKNLRDLNCLIYPLPTVKSLGIHSVLHLNGEVSFGPNIYKVDKIDYTITDKHKTQFLKEISQYIDINPEDIFADFSGIRPKIKYDGYFNDFIIQNEKKIGMKNFINLIGIDSPGLTSSLAIAKYVESLIAK